METTRTFSGIAANTTFEYRIRAHNTSNSSDWSSPVLSITTLCNEPTELTITGQTATSISLSWTASVAGATSYRLERSLTGTNGWEQIGDTITAAIYHDTERNPNTTYYYRISAINSARVVSAPTSTISVTTNKIKLSAPVLAIGTVTANSVALFWNAINDATGDASSKRQCTNKPEQATAAYTPLILVP